MAKSTLKTLRTIRGMTQQQLSEKTGITTRTIQSYEQDVSNLRKAKFETLETIAKALDVSVDSIFLDDISEFLKLPTKSPA